jgi:ferredoxin-NADP reductase
MWCGRRRIELYGGFSSVADVCCAEALDALAAAHPDKFSWTACISRPAACAAVSATPFAGERAFGRVTMAVPPLLRTTASTHFHLIGNGQFVKDMQAGLLGASVDEARVSTEIYFNGKAQPEPLAVEHTAAALRRLDAAAADADDAEDAVIALG